jgi:hypothetical protein
MRFPTLSLALALAVTPAVAAAQAGPGGGPPGDMRAKMEQARSDAKTASFNALSADHRAKVQTIVDRFDAGTLPDPRAAATQIDAVLTPDETTAVLAQRRALRSAMEQSMGARSGGPAGAGDGPPSAGGPGGGGPGPGAPGGGPGPGSDQSGAAGGEHAHRPQPDAGRFLLTVAADPEKLRDALRSGRERAPQ